MATTAGTWQKSSVNNIACIILLIKNTFYLLIISHIKNIVKKYKMLNRITKYRTIQISHFSATKY